MQESGDPQRHTLFTALQSPSAPDGLATTVKPVLSFFPRITARNATLCRAAVDRMSDQSLSLFARDSVLERCFRDFDEGEGGVLDRKSLHFALTALLGRRPTEFERASVIGDASSGT